MASEGCCASSKRCSETEGARKLVGMLGVDLSGLRHLPPTEAVAPELPPGSTPPPGHEQTGGAGAGAGGKQIGNLLHIAILLKRIP